MIQELVFLPLLTQQTNFRPMMKTA